jgi:hypothetical protein
MAVAPRATVLVTTAPVRPTAVKGICRDERCLGVEVAPLGPTGVNTIALTKFEEYAVDLAA